MTNRIVVRLTLVNISNNQQALSLEPYGDYCDLPPATKVHATWEIGAGADAQLEISITDEGLLIGDSSIPLCELGPSRDLAGGELWT